MRDTRDGRRTVIDRWSGPRRPPTAMGFGDAMLRAVIVGLGVGVALGAGVIMAHVMMHDIFDEGGDAEWIFEAFIGVAMFTSPLFSSAVAGLAAPLARSHATAAVAGAGAAALSTVVLYVVAGLYYEVRDLGGGYEIMDGTEFISLVAAALVVGALTGAVAPAMRR